MTLATLVLLLLFAQLSWILWVGLQDSRDRAHVALVMGSQVLPNGLPSNRLKARLERALELYQKKQVAFILVSGGLGKEGHEEAIVMGRYLMRKGVDHDDILVDTEGDDTFQTAANAAKMLESRDLVSVIVVSSYFHILRSQLALSKCGVQPAWGSYARIFEWRDLYWSLPREMLGYVGYFFKECPRGSVLSAPAVEP
ncbi:MAG: YdcF family protein [Candidatus Sericytochromatia bacterium]